MRYTALPKPEQLGASRSMSDDLAQHVGNIARDVSKLSESVKLLEISEQTRLQDERMAVHRRAAFWWKLIGIILSVFLIPTITVIWQAARLIERIDNISEQVRNVTADHELRLRMIEQRHGDAPRP